MSRPDLARSPLAAVVEPEPHPVGGERVLDRLIAEGIVTPARQPKRRAAKPIKTKGTVSDLVGEQRR
jgi:hypothetical protein